MLPSDKLQSSEQGKFKLKQAYKEAKLTQEELAQKANVSVDTVKRLLGTKECPHGVERLAVTNIAKALNIKPTDIVDLKDWNPPQQLPPEFEPIIKGKTKAFCGRQFVFAAFEKFINTKQNGYFTVVGDAGMGKSALAAKYLTY
jgi:transcriptional regulator with XRE-family HTH domain